MLAQADSSSGDASADTAYRPKVATWGIFPRPANISRQYGGGRTFKPGEVHPTVLQDTQGQLAEQYFRV